MRAADYPELEGVDAKLVRMAQDVGGSIVTTDYNLNKVAQIQGVEVLNVNELANALKPAVLPGEPLQVKVIREGREYDQGVGYLQDGTMIVVEGGRSAVGTEITVEVTSVLQSPSGKMIFTKLPEPLEPAGRDEGLHRRGLRKARAVHGAARARSGLRGGWRVPGAERGQARRVQGRIKVVRGRRTTARSSSARSRGATAVLVVPRGSTGTRRHGPSGARLRAAGGALVFSCGWHITRDGQTCTRGSSRRS